MKLSKVALFVLLTFVVASTAASQDAAMDEARAAYDAILVAFNDGDFASYMDGIADDIEAYSGVYTPLRFEGKQAWSDFIGGLEAFAQVRYDRRGATCRTYNDDTLLCNAYFAFTTVTQDGVTETQSGRESTTMVKVGGRWLVANFHFSPLF